MADVCLGTRAFELGVPPLIPWSIESEIRMLPIGASRESSSCDIETSLLSLEAIGVSSTPLDRTRATLVFDADVLGVRIGAEEGAVSPDTEELRLGGSMLEESSKESFPGGGGSERSGRLSSKVS